MSVSYTHLDVYKRQILENGEPILYVSHDEDDGMWQFLCGKAHETDEAKLVSLKSVFEMCIRDRFGGGSDSNSYTPVSAEVEAYEPTGKNDRGLV